MSLMIPSRVDVPELLDEPGAPRADVERSLLDLRRFNRWLGGRTTYCKLLARLAALDGASILDVGTGSSDLLESVETARLRVGLDFKIEHLLYSRASSAVQKVVGDVRALPFRNGSIDVVTSALFFHHFGPEENAVILRESARVARRGVAVNDIRRHRLPMAFMWVIGALRLVGRITRYDAIASFRRAYTMEEARAIARHARAGPYDIVAAFPFRLGVLLSK